MSQRFDNLARAMATKEPVARRGLLRWAVVLGLGGGGSVLAAQAAAADPPAGAGQPCPPGQHKCDGTCRDLANANTDCGACGNVCDEDEICRDGTCTPIPCTCQEPTCTSDGDCGAGSYCDGTDCQPLQADGTSCSRDGECLSGRCDGGICLQPGCPPGQTECGGVCVDTDSDRQHCGGCDVTCPSGNTCVHGQCQVSCPAGQTDCGGVCVDTSSDPQHCGACNDSCGGHVCNQGVCETTCASDVDCQAGHYCDGGACAAQKPSGDSCAADHECQSGACSSGVCV